MYILMRAFMVLFFSHMILNKTIEALCEDQIHMELFGHLLAAPDFL